MEELSELLEKVKELFITKDYGGCESLLNAHLSLLFSSPTNKNLSSKHLIQRNLVNILIKLEEYEKALEVSNQLIEFDGENPTNFRRRSIVYQNLNKYQDALEDLQRAQDLAKRNGNVQEMVLIKQEKLKIDILNRQESYWLIE